MQGRQSRDAVLYSEQAMQASDELRTTAAREAFARTIERIERLVELETATLQDYRPLDFADFNHKKSHALLELSRAMRALGPASHDSRTLTDLSRLRGKLEKNLAVLNIHLKAVRQVCALIARTIEDDDSDGTYTPSINKMARRP
jgi:uncharacterized protein (UPF0335 family)